MPVYANSFGYNVKQAVPGFPVYLIGSCLTDSAPTQFNVSTVALSGTTATVVGTVVAGNIPVAGQTITFTGITPSYFNVTNATILTVSSPAATDVGVYTITFTLANSNITTTASTGVGIAPPPEVGESITLGGLSTWTSAACSLQAIQGTNVEKGLRASVRFPTALGGSCTVELQTADVDIDGAYVTNATKVITTSTLANAVMYTGNNAIVACFVRFKVSAIVSPGSGKIVATILV